MHAPGPIFLLIALGTALGPATSAEPHSPHGTGPPHSHASEDPESSPAEPLIEWLEQVQRGRTRFREENINELATHLRTLDRGPELAATDRGAAFLALLDIAAFRLEPARGMPPELAKAAARMGRTALEDELRYESRRGALIDWLRDTVLAGGPEHPRQRKIAGIELLAGREEPTTRLALLHLARSTDPALTVAALEALAGWRDNEVHDLFMDALESSSGNATPAGRAAKRTESEPPLAERPLLELLELHLAGIGAPLESPYADRLAAWTGPRLMSEDWRAATLALRLVPALPSKIAAPQAIEALTAWQRRSEEGTGGSLRVEYALVDELQRRAGRNLGLAPGRWALWWERVQSGELSELDEWGEKAGERTTSATFFGLQPRSDRVLFVIDRSTSMARPLSYRTDRTRFQEAQEQLERYLLAVGPRARFGLAVFSDKGRRWRSRLSAATPQAISEARRWLAANPPDGGTFLATGLNKALDLRQGRPLDPSKVDADTIVVLCDGATYEDADWAREWLDSHNHDAELVFHCVQIGGSSAASLEALANGSHGTFVRADG